MYTSTYGWSSVGCRFINREGVQTRSCDNTNSPTLSFFSEIPAGTGEYKQKCYENNSLSDDICRYVYDRKCSRKKVLNLDSMYVMEQTAMNSIKFKGLFENINQVKIDYTIQLYSLYKLDVCSFYRLDEYNTELKRKVFKDTPEGKRLMQELKIQRQKMINSKLYYVFPFRENKGWGSEYNLKTRTFDFSYLIHNSEFMKLQEYTSFPEIVIKCNPVIKQRLEFRSIGESHFATVKIPMSEKNALPIEENVGNMALVIEFKLQNVREREGLLSDIIQGIATRIYIINTSTSEIYFSL